MSIMCFKKILCGIQNSEVGSLASVRTTWLFRPDAHQSSNIRPDDVVIPSGLPSVFRSFKLFKVASVWTPFSVQIKRFPSQTQIWEDSSNRLDDRSTLSIVMKTGKNSKRPIKYSVKSSRSLQTEKSSLLPKIQDLKEKLLETQLQLERVTDEKLTHMLSIQKSPTDKTRLRYVGPPSDIPSTSRTVFVKPTVLGPPLTVVDKGNEVIGGDISVTQKPPTIRRPPICQHCGLNGTIRPHCSLLKT
jgi:hypothetical protein